MRRFTTVGLLANGVSSMGCLPGAWAAVRSLLLQDGSWGKRVSGPLARAPAR